MGNQFQVESTWPSSPSAKATRSNWTNYNVITLGVRDLAAARRFYVDGLGWKPTLDVPGEVVFIQIGHGLLLSLPVGTISAPRPARGGR
jgi:catechol 2,3-dioxygenase-like lactoylglutathione lyase family enzyme